MYIGRIVAIARTKDNRGAALYRVSSRSFPNRMAKTLANAVAIVPKPGFENDIQKNPYIAYDCLRLANGYAIVTNGSQTDPIAEKIASGITRESEQAMTMASMAWWRWSMRFLLNPFCNSSGIAGISWPSALIAVKQSFLVSSFNRWKRGSTMLFQTSLIPQSFFKRSVTEPLHETKFFETASGSYSPFANFSRTIFDSNPFINLLM